jgi:hypothetical protein
MLVNERRFTTETEGWLTLLVFLEARAISGDQALGIDGL